MKLYTHILVLLGLSGALGLPSPSPRIAHGLINECGQTLHVTESASIEYKLGQPFNENEICPFIVRVDNAASLNFELLASGFGSYAKLSVATLKAIQSWPHGTALEARELADGADSVTLEGSVAIVTFTTFGVTGTGFSLNITKIGQSEVILSPNSVDQVVASNAGVIRHPEQGQEYYDNELSAFLIAPENFATNYNGHGATVLTYNEHGIEGSCHDMVEIWSFSKYYALEGGWRHIKMLCRGDFGLLPYVEELALVTFFSDASYTNLGFSVNYEKPGGAKNTKFEE